MSWIKTSYGFATVGLVANKLLHTSVAAPVTAVFLLGAVLALLFGVYRFLLTFQHLFRGNFQVNKYTVAACCLMSLFSSIAAIVVASIY